MLPPKSFLPEFADRIALLEDGPSVSPFCIGIVEDEDVVPAAFDAGINFFFITADMHWPLYEKTRRGLIKLFARGGGVRDDVVVAVVCYVTQPEFCIAPFSEVLDVVPGLDRVDVAVAGGAYAHEIGSRLSVYHSRHRRERLFGRSALGTTFHDRKAALLVVNNRLIDIGFIRYNAGHPGARAEVFPFLDADKRAPLYNFKSVGGYVDPMYFSQLGFDEDFWQPKVTDHYRFVLSRPEIDGILCAPTEVHMVQELADAMDEGPLDEEEEQFLIDLASTARSKAGSLIPVDPETGKPVYY
ncbi:MAG: hypothetical protein AAF725_14440 [Acidobacteriota bacterium]